jgi:heme-degrading monooxygenase HmoA
MFARSVTIRLKPNAIGDFNRVLENDILPLLRKQKGFREELALVAPNQSEVLGISLWDAKEDAEAYHRTTFPEVQNLLSKVTAATPQVQTYEVSVTTLEKTATRRGGASG